MPALFLLAGCVGNIDDESPIVLDGEDLRCVRGMHCPDLVVDGDHATLHVGTLEGRGGVALVVRNPPPTLVIADAMIDGFEVGIRVVDSCSSCHLEIKDATVTGAKRGIVADVGASVALQNVTVSTIGGGTVQEQVMNKGELLESSFFIQLDGAYGVELRGNGSSYHARDVEISAEGPSAGTGLGIQDADAAKVELTDVAVRDHDVGISVRGAPAPPPIGGAREGSHLEVSNVSIDCARDGIEAFSGTVTMNDVEIRSCTGYGIELSAAVDADLRHIAIRDSRFAIELRNDERFRLEDFQFIGNDYGLLQLAQQLSRESGIIRDGMVVDQTYVGLQTKWQTTQISNVHFEGNGHGWPDPDARPLLDPDGLPERYGGLVFLDPAASDSPDSYTPVATLSGSLFIDNAPYAVSNRGTQPLDARENYWGNPAGPSLQPYRIAPAVGTGSQTVYGIVETAPHRTAP